MTTNKTEIVTCPKCLGARVFRTFLHVDNGRCFTCAGTGTIEITEEFRKAARRARPPSVERTRLDLRAMYNNAAQGLLTYEYATDGEVRTAGQFADMLDDVPGAREAFRALGWPV